MAELHGTCHEGFRRVREAFEKNLDNGNDIGASAAVTIDGAVRPRPGRSRSRRRHPSEHLVWRASEEWTPQRWLLA